MEFKKAALSAAALAMPLTALAAAPASATDYGHDDDHGYYHHKAEKPEVYIKGIKVHRGDISVVVKFKCDTEYGKHDHDKVKDGYLKVVLAQKKASYAGFTKVDCDNEWGYAKVDLDKKHGYLKSGHAYVKAQLTDPQWKKAYDSKKVHVVVKKHHDKKYDKKH